MSNPMHVIIIGAGTGGLCLAHGLKRAGISVAVYERDRTRIDGLYGYRVGISPLGSTALAECLPPELFQVFVDTCARSPQYFNILTEQLEQVFTLAMPANPDPVKAERAVSRMTLRQVLLTGLEDVVHFDKKFLSYEKRDDGHVVARFEDGSEAVGDLLVGADGANSPVRQQRLPNAQMADTGIRSVGGKLPLTAESKALLSNEVFYGISLMMAPHGVGGIIHVMEFPWRHKERPDNQRPDNIGGNDPELLARWPGLLYDNTRDYINWAVWAAQKNLPAPFHTESLPRDPQVLTNVVRAVTQGWHPNFHRLIELTDPTTFHPLRIRTSVPMKPWQTDNVTLLGDAVHTMTPGRGVGANTALRDAAVLCRQLTEVAGGRKPLLDAVHAYEVEMLRYSKDAVIASRKQIDARGLAHKPVAGRALLALTRTGLRIANQVPALKRRRAQADFRLRSADLLKAG